MESVLPAEVFGEWTKNEFYIVQKYQKISPFI